MSWKRFFGWLFFGYKTKHGLRHKKGPLDGAPHGENSDMDEEETGKGFNAPAWGNMGKEPTAFAKEKESPTTASRGRLLKKPTKLAGRRKKKTAAATAGGETGKESVTAGENFSQDETTAPPDGGTAGVEAKFSAEKGPDKDPTTLKEAVGRDSAVLSRKSRDKGTATAGALAGKEPVTAGEEFGQDITPSDEPGAGKEPADKGMENEGKTIPAGDEGDKDGAASAKRERDKDGATTFVRGEGNKDGVTSARGEEDKDRATPASRKLTTEAEGELGEDLDTNIARIKTAFGDSADLVVRELETLTDPSVKLAVILIDGLINDLNVAENVIGPLLTMPAGLLPSGKKAPENFFAAAQKKFLQVGEVSETADLGEIFTGLSSGKTVILFEQNNHALLTGTQGWKERGIEEPATESVVRGPRDSFTESIRSNTALVRLRLKTSRLWIEELQIGELTKTKVALVFIQGLVSHELLQEVKRRLGRINIDGVLESGYLEEFIEDEPLSPFPQILRSERPDRVAAFLMEGKVAIFTDGTPFVLLVPSFLPEFLTTPEDYYERYFIASFVRLIRYASFIISLVLPSIYVAIVTFHQEMLPTPLILSIASQREGVPFPTFVEALLLELAFEVLREAGLRLPRVIGQAVSIVGVLIIGQAAVQAGLFSQFMLVVVALTAIASFATPVFSLAITLRLLRFVFLFLASALGFFGVLIGVYAVLLHLVSLRSFGYPYLKPLGPVILSDLKDSMIRAPLWAMRTRPRLVVPWDLIRQARDLKPEPPPDQDSQGLNNKRRK